MDLESFVKGLSGEYSEGLEELENIVLDLNKAKKLNKKEIVSQKFELLTKNLQKGCKIFSGNGDKPPEGHIIYVLLKNLISRRGNPVIKIGQTKQILS